jgi:hypothetical protein
VLASCGGKCKSFGAMAAAAAAELMMGQSQHTSSTAFE